MLQVIDLKKAYTDKEVLKGLNFSIEKGEIVGFLGKNGAGKSTTMNIITGYVTKTSGSVLVNSVDLMNDPLAAKRQIGYLPERPPLYLDMTVEEQLLFVYRLRRLTLDRERHFADICDKAGISDVRGKIIGRLSKGYRQRVGIAQALLGYPEILILDEPTSGMDPAQIMDIMRTIKSLGKEHTVLFSSHILSEISEICSRVLLLNNGQIVADGSPQSLSDSISTLHKLSMQAFGDPKQIYQIIMDTELICSCEYKPLIEESAFEFTMETNQRRDIRVELLRTLIAKEVPVLAFCESSLSLEEIFIKMVEKKED